MALFQYLRDMHPYRQLLLAVLCVVVAAQVVAMVALARSQVTRAAVRDAAERSVMAQKQAQPVAAAPRDGAVFAEGALTVGYAAAR